MPYVFRHPFRYDYHLVFSLCFSQYRIYYLETLSFICLACFFLFSTQIQGVDLFLFLLLFLKSSSFGGKAFKTLSAFFKLFADLAQSLTKIEIGCIFRCFLNHTVDRGDSHVKNSGICQLSLLEIHARQENIPPFQWQPKKLRGLLDSF